MTPRLIAIGDIHGCLAELKQLLSILCPRSGDHLVFLGDYVDRGPRSADVLTFLLAFAEGSFEKGVDVTFLRGNHEQLMLDARDGGTADLQLWIGNGGGATLQSYIDRETKTRAPGTIDNVRWQDLLPAAHWRFIERTEMYLRQGRYVFVHGGMDPTLSPGQNLLKPNLGALLWERRHLDADLGAWVPDVVVCGHSIQPEPIDRPNLVCIDTGAFLPYLRPEKAGALTAVVLPRERDGEREFVSVPAGLAVAAEA